MAGFDLVRELWLRRTLRGYKTAQGAPPLSFTAKAGTLKNYRIYGNTVNGESVGELVSSGEHEGEYCVPVTVSGKNREPVTTTIYLPEPLRMVGEETEYVDYEEQKQHRVRKNLLQTTGTSQTINGVTFTFNSDGSVTCNGTASANTMKNASLDSFKLNNFILNGCPTGGSWDTFQLDIIQVESPYTILYRDIGTGVSVDTLNVNVYLRIRIASGYTCNNLTFYPMIRKADIEDDTYEPYIENTELDVTLPELPTLAGTNVLTVGTAVQPSKVYVKGEKGRE